VLRLWILSLLLPAAATAADYAQDVRPLLAARCYGCHGPKVQMSKLRLDSKANVLSGGESGVPSIEPGNAAASLLIRYVEGGEKMVMPPAGPKLTPAEVQVLKDWINAGAVWPDDQSAPSAHPPDKRADHWSFQPPAKPAIPAVRNRAWVRSPIDAFVLAKLEAKGWQPNPPASSAALLRRVTLDLTGLPPTIAEQDGFDGNIDALVARLLATPAYGERWARHWLDVVRYGETNGYERDAYKPQVWRYRDYVIDAFNADKPFNRFLVEQIAGDELPDANEQTMIATGYHRLGPWDDEPANPEEDRFDQLDDIVSTTALAFQGLTLGCARCHNHKFEPLSTRDYYSMVAVFNGLDRPRNGRTELDRPAGPIDQVHRYRDIEQQAAKLRADFRQQWLASGDSKLPPEALQAFRTPAADRTEEQRKLIRDHTKALDAELKASVAEREALALEQTLPPLTRGYFLEERSSTPKPSHVLIRGKASAPGPEVGPAVPAILTRTQPLFPTPAPGARSSLRRLTFANWLASRENPLTARVIVNRVWQWHFGEGLVRTASDFGVMGDKPTHPELLDWLAVWFMDNGWSIKKLHALILSSNTYRMSKASNAAYEAEDPENRMLWRMFYRRMEAEAILDSALAVSGRANRQMYGPSVYPHVPKEALEGSSDPDKIWKPFDEQQSSRRAIYYIVKRSLMVPMLEALDLCDTARSSPKRQTTAVAPQAMQLFNGDFINRQARHFARRVREEAGPQPTAQIERAYRLALARRPTGAETATMQAFLASSTLEEMCRVILNLNEFVYTD
jgi:mono/diheme cytochrome c family protein